MQNYRNALANTRQVLNKVRLDVIAEAQAIADRAGSEAILVTRLATKYGISFATCKSWLETAGFKLNKSLKGRPSFEAVLIHDGLMDALKMIKARETNEG